LIDILEVRKEALIALIMQAVSTSETSVNFYETTFRIIQEDCNPKKTNVKLLFSGINTKDRCGHNLMQFFLVQVFIISSMADYALEDESLLRYFLYHHQQDGNPH
jgi:hypothetical protein